MRSGVIAQKVGMTRIFTEAGEHVPVTVLEGLRMCQVLAHRTDEKNGYTAICSSGPARASHRGITRPERGTSAVSPSPKSSPSARLAEFRVSPDNLIEVGAEITADHFVKPGQFVDVTGTVAGQGLSGRDEALELQAVCAPPTACRSPTAVTARPVSVRTRARSSRARRWPARWATSGSRRRISS